MVCCTARVEWIAHDNAGIESCCIHQSLCFEEVLSGFRDFVSLGVAELATPSDNERTSATAASDSLFEDGWGFVATGGGVEDDDAIEGFCVVLCIYFPNHETG